MYDPAVCVSMCLLQVGKLLNRLRWFLAQRFPSTYPTLFHGNLGIAKKSGRFLWELGPKLWALKEIWHVDVACFVNLV